MRAEAELSLLGTKHELELRSKPLGSCGFRHVGQHMGSGLMFPKAGCVWSVAEYFELLEAKVRSRSEPGCSGLGLGLLAQTLTPRQGPPLPLAR